MNRVRVRPDAGTLAGSVAAAKAMNSFDRVLLLDDLWTAFVSALDPADRPNIERHLDELGELVDDLDQALRDAVEQAGELRMVLNSAEEREIDIDGTFAATLSEAHPNAAATLEAMFSAEGMEVGPRGAAIFACDYLAEEGDGERSNLREKYERLRAGGPPDSDLRPCFRCALQLAKLGASAAAAVSLLIAGHVDVESISGVVAPGVGAVTGWKKFGCVECWHTITGGRFT